jgi:hypothetical protein
MPAQAARANLIAYGQFDRAPSSRLTLCDGADVPIPLQSATKVELRIGYARYSHYYSGRDPITTDSPTTIDPDQVTNPGVVHWTPRVGETDIPGNFHVSAKIFWNDGTDQTVPNMSYIPMTVLTQIGGSGS